ncbi:MAG TPA: HAMP domain-containing sensor histidine kinase [Candidatus Cybelea sp.]|nr:HAMP domain-containing sensor histidine kinase [Candidatus Cybelea sp.]
MLDLRELANAIGERAVLPALGHELRTPLTSIRGYLETVLEGETDPRNARRFLEAAHRETLRLDRLIAGILEAPSLAPPRRRSCDLVPQIRATVEIVAPMAHKRGVTIRTRLPKSAVARIDPDECVHALANLLENAIKHGSERGTVRISCRLAERHVEAAVEDDGSGVAPGERAAIFELGARGAHSDRTGSGIGLAVVKAIAERAAGEVRVDASPLGGARFVLRLPAG